MVGVPHHVSEGFSMVAVLLYIFAGVCFLGAIQERKDLLRCVGMIAVAMIFGILGLALG